MSGLYVIQSNYIYICFGLTGFHVETRMLNLHATCVHTCEESANTYISAPFRSPPAGSGSTAKSTVELLCTEAAPSTSSLPSSH